MRLLGRPGGLPAIAGPGLPLPPTAILAASVLLLISGWTAAPALADRPAEANPDSALADALTNIEGASLSLDAAVQAALQNATEAREAEADLAAARGAVRREKGSFDPELFGNVQRASTEQRTASPFAGADVLKTKESAGEGGARIHLPFGGDLEAALAVTRNETNSAFASLNPEYDATGSIRIAQPLLKGFGLSARRDLSAAERDLEAAQERKEDADLAVRARVEETYWSLYAAQHDLAVQQLIRNRAQALLDEATLRAKAGLVGPNEIANSRVFLSEQEQAVLDREEELDRTSDALASLMGSRPAGGRPRFLPADPPPREFTPPSQEELVAAALRDNRQIRAAERAVESARVRAQAARWDALPQLDLLGSIGGTGLAGRSREVVFGADTLRTKVSGGVGDTWDQVLHRDFPTWSAGLRLSIPIGLRYGRGEHERLRAELVRAQEQKTAVARSIEEEVRANYRALSNGSRRLSVARDGLDAAFEQVRIGLVQYRNGRTTAFELVRLGADLATAQQRYSQALIRAAKASAELRHLTAGGYPASTQ